MLQVSSDAMLSESTSHFGNSLLKHFMQWAMAITLLFCFPDTGGKLFSRACCNSARDNVFKLKEGRLRLDRRKTFLAVRFVRQSNRLPREALDAPSLKVFKVRSNGALGSLVTFRGPLQPELCYDSVILHAKTVMWAVYWTGSCSFLTTFLGQGDWQLAVTCSSFHLDYIVMDP